MSSNSLTTASHAELEREQGFTGLERSAATGRAVVPLTGGTARVEARQGPLRRCAACGSKLGDDSSLATDGVNEAVRVCSACVSER